MSQLDKMLAVVQQCLDDSKPLPQFAIDYFGEAIHRHGPNPRKLRRVMQRNLASENEIPNHAFEGTPDGDPYSAPSDSLLDYPAQTSSPIELGSDDPNELLRDWIVPDPAEKPTSPNDAELSNPDKETKADEDIFDIQLESQSETSDSGLFSQSVATVDSPELSSGNVKSGSGSKNPVMYCASCWRDDVHKPCKISLIKTFLLALLSLGLIFVVWPHRCSTCGKLRLKQFRKKSGKR